MDDDVDPIQRNVEQQVRLEQLQALVDQGGGVGRDHPSHVPGGMGEGLAGGDVGELDTGPAAERTAASGENQPVDLAGAATTQALGQRRVLGVDGHDLAGPCSAGDQPAADHQGLLVGQREPGAGPQRRERRSQAGRTGDSVEHHVARLGRDLTGRLRTGDDPRQSGVAGGPAAPAGFGVERELEVLHHGCASHPDNPGIGLQGLPREQRDIVSTGGESDHPELAGPGRDHLEGLGPDRPGAPQDHDVAHPVTLAGPSRMEGCHTFPTPSRQTAHSEVDPSHVSHLESANGAGDA